MEETSTCSSGMSQRDMTAMKETLLAQQQLLQKLYAELDQEREASATAASEALDMILRLQGEKAAVKMEASHYKRMAEEKIGHAEATLEVFEELMYQKEMEIASLEYQVQAYKHKLLSLGCDLSASDFEFPEDLLSTGYDQQNEENGQSSSNVRRLHSLPPLPSKSTLRAARKRERSPSPAPVPVSDVSPNMMENTEQEVRPPSLDLTRKSVDFVYGTLDSYWNQIKKLDEKVKEISDCVESEGEKSVNLRSRRGKSCSASSQASSKVTFDQTDRLTNSTTNSDKGNLVHDVFEVPQTSEKQKVSEHGKIRPQKWDSEAESRLTKPESVPEGMDRMVESQVRQDTDKQKSKLIANREIKVPSPKEMLTMINQRKEGLGVDWNAQADFQKLLQRVERLERERTSTRQEITQEGNGEELLRLLKEIHSQLKLIQSDIRSLKTKKATPMDDVPLGPLQEAMLHFWL